MRKTLDVPFELKDLSEDGTFTGYGSVFDVEDSYKDIVAPGAFAKTLKAWAKRKASPPMLWQHDAREPIGVYSAMEEDKRGLKVTGQLALATQRGLEAYELLKLKAISGLSIGYISKKSSFDESTGIRTLTEVDLWELSLVTFPANDKARIQTVKSLLGSGELPTEREFEAFLREAGFTRTQAAEITAKGYARDAQKTPKDQGDVLAALLRRGEAWK